MGTPLPTYKIRDLINASKETIWALPDRKICVVFEDGTEMIAHSRSTIFSWYSWRFFRMDPSFKILPEHHFGNRTLTKKAQLSFMGKCMTDVIQHVRHTTGIDIYAIQGFWKAVYEAQNELYNDMTYQLEEYVTTMSALDIVEALDHPEIKEANSKLQPTEGSIRRTHEAVLGVLKDPTALPGNNLARQVQIGGVDSKQALQVVSAIGYRTEIDSALFPHPILSSFGEGIKNIHDWLIESRSASKSLMFTKSPLADTQYFNREMQLETNVVARLHHGTDCGSTVTVPFHVTKGSLEILDGKFHLLEDGTLELIRPNSEHLIGKTVQLRSIYGCCHKDGQGVCSTCFGELAWSYAFGTNVGHACVVEVCEKISQLVLSVKHIDSSSTAEAVHIEPSAQKLIVEGSKPNTIRIKSWLKDHNVRMRFGKQAATGMPLVQRQTNLKTLNLWDISAMDSVYMVYSSRVGETCIPINVSMGSRLGSFTLPFVEYLREAGVGFMNTEFYEVSLDNWDFSQDVWQLPLRHRNMLEYKGEVEEFIKAGKQFEGRLKTQVTAELFGEELRKFQDLISSKLTINIVHLEVVLYSTMIRSSELGDYRLPRPGTTKEFASYNDLLGGRSLAPAMAYQGQRTRIRAISSYLNRRRPTSPLDPILRGKW